MGVELKLNTIVERIEPKDHRVNIRLKDGNSSNPDFILIGVGVSACLMSSLIGYRMWLADEYLQRSNIF